MAFTQASVRRLPGSPVSGWTWVNSVTWRAPSHSPGESTPSTMTADASDGSAAQASANRGRTGFMRAPWAKGPGILGGGPGSAEAHWSCRAGRLQAFLRPFFGCSMVPVHLGEPQRQAQSFFSLAVCGSASTMP